MKNRILTWVLLLLLLLPLMLLLPGQLAAAGAGYFHVEKRSGVWWLIDPSASPMLSVGVDNIRYDADTVQNTDVSHYRETVEKNYPDHHAWALATLARLQTWGFNTIGAWSSSELWNGGMPYTLILNISLRAGGQGPVDVYDWRFENAARTLAELACLPRQEDHLLIGYYSDNELVWGSEEDSKHTMLGMYLKLLPAASAGRQQAIKFLRQVYSNDIQKLNKSWGVEAKSFSALPLPGRSAAFDVDADQFGENMADRYFEVCARTIRGVDPNHMYFGARFAGRVPDAVLRAARVVDVLSINIYDFDPRPLVKHAYEVTGKPILLTEFSFRAKDSGLPNSTNAGPLVPDQRARGKAYTNFVTRLESLPEAVGYHWFQWSDQPKEGRFDGENSNYGLVDINDHPYKDFIEAIKAANEAALAAHRKSQP